jgi:hypothetical protein
MHPDLVFSGGRSWFRTSDPSLVSKIGIVQSGQALSRHAPQATSGMLRRDRIGHLRSRLKARPQIMDLRSSIGDERWDALLAALAEHLAAQHDLAPPEWADLRVLRRPWFPPS